MSIKTRMQDSSNWILNSPESLVILLLMGTGMAGILFFFLTIAMFFNEYWILVVLFAFFSYGSLRQFIKLIKMVKLHGMKEALSGITANEFVWHKNKDGNKIYGGVEDGSSGFESDEVCSERDAEEDKRIRKKIGYIYR